MQGTLAGRERRRPVAVRRHPQPVATLQVHAGRRGWQVADAAHRRLLPATAQFQPRFGDQVGGFLPDHQRPGGSAMAHPKLPLGATGIDQMHGIAHPQLRQPGRLDPDACRSIRNRRDTAQRMQSDLGRFGHRTPGVAPGLDFEHGWSAGDGAGAQLGAGEIHQDAYRPSGAARLPTDPPCHGDPRLRGIVRAVDAGNVHTALYQHRYQAVVAGRGTRQGDHDAHAARLGRRSEQPLGVLRQQRRATLRADRFVAAARCPRPPHRQVQQAQHLVHAGQRMRLGAAERRHTDPGQTFLQVADVLAAHGKVVRQVDGAGLPVRLHLIQPSAETLLRLLHGGTQLQQFLDQGLTGRRVPRAGRGRKGRLDHGRAC
ncbi:MAG TPA: hypothetical protein VGD25_03690 [Immundisolibacter sp.]